MEEFLIEDKSSLEKRKNKWQIYSSEINYCDNYMN